MSTNPPSLPSPYAPLSDVTNDAVAFALPPPPPFSGVPRVAPTCRRNKSLWDGSEKRPSNLALVGYSPAKKKGGRRTRGAGISPHNTDASKQYPSNEDNNDNADYSPTPAYKAS